MNAKTTNTATAEKRVKKSKIVIDYHTDDEDTVIITPKSQKEKYLIHLCVHYLGAEFDFPLHNTTIEDWAKMEKGYEDSIERRLKRGVSLERQKSLNHNMAEACINKIHADKIRGVKDIYNGFFSSVDNKIATKFAKSVICLIKLGAIPFGYKNGVVGYEFKNKA
jgi:hypothetical protein